MTVETNLKRIFIVGPPRSGTTLLLSRLGLNSQIAVYPETGFFPCIDPQFPFNHPLLSERSTYMRSSDFAKEVRKAVFQLVDQSSAPLRLCGLSGPHRACRAYRDLMLAVGGKHAHEIGCFIPVPLSKHAERFCQILDQSTVKSGKSVWVEKSPHHLFHAETIERFIPGAKFIHMTRSATDVAASIYDAALKHGGFWNRFRNLDAIVLVLNASAQRTQNYINRPNHMIVPYSDMTADPEAVMSKLCHFIDVPFEAAMMDTPGDSSNLFHANEQWKHNVLQPIYNKPDNRFESLFSVEEQTYLISRLLNR